MKVSKKVGRFSTQTPFQEALVQIKILPNQSTAKTPQEVSLAADQGAIHY